MSQPQAKIQLTLSPQAGRYVQRDAPVEVRRLAARGALPLEPIELATVLFVLANDADAQVKETAHESLRALPESIAKTVLSGAAHPAVLSFLAQLFRDDASKSEWIALNAHADDETIAFLASLPHRRVIDIVANNQTRLLRAPQIVDALGENPLTGRATIDRILSFLGLERPATEELPEGESATDLAREEITDESALAALRAILGDDCSEFAKELLEDKDGELSEEEQGSLFALVQKMSVMQKVKLARMGNKEARGLLIRDRNKIVSTAAIRSPRMTSEEVAGFAKSRNLSDEVMRIIASNREWTKEYAVKLALVMNPKCPISFSIRFMNFLQERDLLKLMKSKDVPAVIATHARRNLSKKGKA
ncbi:MAG: hypothetical protein FJ091_11905 [Deltaproteobacteria bacterium]|nr:hypothetical protein [Deltaproteobacteria bacterium]